MSMTDRTNALLIHQRPNIVEQRSYVSGHWVEMIERSESLHDPNTGEIRQPKRATREDDVEVALSSARRFFEEASEKTVPLQVRVDIINAVAEELDRRQEEIALQDSINMGAPITTSRIIASSLGARVRAAVRDALELGEYLELGEDDRPVRLLRKPIGPALIVGPWNAPTFTVVGKVAAAFLAGCPVILKPSENAPSGCQIFSELLITELEKRDIKPGYFQLIQGSAAIGSILTSDSRIEAVSFTGGVSAGRTVAMAAAENLNIMQMELGSNNPVIVRADADIAFTAASLVQGMTRLNGQWCESPGKILVHESIHDVFVEAMRLELNKLRVGDALDPETQVGPIAFERQFLSLLKEVKRLESLGGILISTESVPRLEGWFLAPGMIVGTEAKDAKNELFGPLVTVHTYSTDEQALGFANAPGGGLDAFVFSSDLDAAMKIGSDMRAGEVRINGTFMSDLAEGGYQSFWGTSGIGGHSPQFGIRFFLGDRVVGVDRTDFSL